MKIIITESQLKMVINEEKPVRYFKGEIDKLFPTNFQKHRPSNSEGFLLYLY